MDTQSTKHDLEISGMTCASCVRHVEGALTAVPGVASASVNFATQRARVITQDAIGATPLVEAVTKAGYGARLADPGQKHRGHDHHEHLMASGASSEELTAGRDFGIAAVLALPLVVGGMAHGLLPWMDGALGRGLQLVVATAVIAWPGRRFFVGAFAALRRRSADMSTLVALGTGAAWLYSTVAVVTPGLFPHAEHGARPHIYFEAAAAIIAFVLLGKYLEARSRKRLSDAVRKLVALQPRTARRLSQSADEEVPIDALKLGDLVRVRAGERIPMDGDVIEGASAIDESMLTGESEAVEKAAGSAVSAGTLNRVSPLTVRVSRLRADSTLARIAAAVEEAQGSRAPIARLADVISSYFVPAVLAFALVTFAAWALLDPTAAGIALAIERFVAVLVIACPCALGLATPAAVAVATGRGAELGILIKGGAPLEAASRIDTVIFDKTGTLTRGKPELADVITVSAVEEGVLLGLVASAERDSEHPVARALVQAAQARGIDIVRARHIEVSAGFGITADVGGKSVRVGTSAWLAAAGVDVSALEAEADRLARQGRTPAFVAVDARLAGLVAVADRPRESSAGVVRALQARGLDVMMVSGDREATAKAVAADLGIKRVIGDVRPEEKTRVVALERTRGRRVAMVGDGVNDAPALAAADIGVAVAGGTDIAAAAADVTLTHDGVTGVPVVLNLARVTMRTIRQNLFWAFVYNILGIPIAAGALYPWTGWLLSPVLASIAMSLSSVSVLANSLRLRRFGRARGDA